MPTKEFSKYNFKDHLHQNQQGFDVKSVLDFNLNLLNSRRWVGLKNPHFRSYPGDSNTYGTSLGTTVPNPGFFPKDTGTRPNYKQAPLEHRKREHGGNSLFIFLLKSRRKRQESVESGT